MTRKIENLLRIPLCNIHKAMMEADLTPDERSVVLRFMTSYSTEFGSLPDHFDKDEIVLLEKGSDKIVNYLRLIG